MNLITTSPFTHAIVWISLIVSLCPNLQAQAATRSSTTDDDKAALIDLISGIGSKELGQKNGEKPTADATAQTSDPDPADKKPELSTKPVIADQPSAGISAMQKTADEGIQIQVEKSVSMSGPLNRSGRVKVYSPWPAKPISPAPSGWEFAPAPAGLKVYKTTIELGSGKKVGLSITPFVLVPASDGINAIRISEPGYDSAQQYAQENTVGMMLQKATTELEENEKQAADAISRLQQLLSSLPQK